MPDWLTDAMKVAAGIVAALVGVWIARINREATLAETLRRQEESSRQYLKDELRRRDDESEKLKLRVRVLERAQGRVRRLVREALDRLALGQQADEHFAAILKALDDTE